LQVIVFNNVPMMNSDCFCVAVAQSIFLVGAMDMNLGWVEAMRGAVRRGRKVHISSIC